MACWHDPVCGALRVAVGSAVVFVTVLWSWGVVQLVAGTTWVHMQALRRAAPGGCLLAGLGALVSHGGLIGDCRVTGLLEVSAPVDEEAVGFNNL